MSTTMQDNTGALQAAVYNLERLNSYSSALVPAIEVTSVSYQGTKPSKETPHRFNIRVVGRGALREGDEIQLCYRVLTTRRRAKSEEEGGGYYPRRRKYKYRCFWNKIVEGAAASSNAYIDLDPEWEQDPSNDWDRPASKKVRYALYHDQRCGNKPDGMGYIYLRIKRNTGSEEAPNITFSNIVPIGKTTVSYTNGYDGAIRYYI